MAKGGEEALILAVMRQAMLDALGRFSTYTPNGPAQQHRAKRFIDGQVFDQCCEFVGANVHVIRRELSGSGDEIAKRIGRADRTADISEENHDG